MLIEDMESFLPSEVARLVYGYLEEENCLSAAQAFLESSDHLQECLSVAKKGRKFNTRILGRNLTGLLDMLSGSRFPQKVKEKVESSHSPERDQFNSDGVHCSATEDQKFGIINSQGDTQDNTPSSCDNQPVTDQLTKDSNKELIPAESRGSDEPSGLNVKKDLYPELDPMNMIESCNEENYSEQQEQHRFNRGLTESGMGPSTSLAAAQPQQQSSSILFQSYNMLHMIQPQPRAAINVQQTFQPSNVPTVYMQAVPSQVTTMQNGLFGANSGVQQTQLPTVVSTVTTPTTQQALWAKPEATVLRKMTRMSQTEQVKSTPRKRYRNLKPGAVPKLRPIAPKITQVLENGVQVQVMHTKEAPLVDLSETVPNIMRRCLRSRTKADSTNCTETRSQIPSTDDNCQITGREHSPPSPGQPPPSPLFIDIQNFDLKR